MHGVGMVHEKAHVLYVALRLSPSPFCEIFQNFYCCFFCHELNNYLLSCSSSSFFCPFFQRPESFSAFVISHSNWPLVLRNSSAAHFSNAFILSSSRRSTNFLLAINFSG